MKPLAIHGAWVHRPQQWEDERGAFLELFRDEHIAMAAGSPLAAAQGNLSVSRRNTLRGVHFADIPPGQAKYVTCVSGAILDVVVDVRVGSPTFGQWDAVELDDRRRAAVFLREGLGHAFLALSEDAVVVYLVSHPYRPHREHGINPLDPDLALPWPPGTSPLLSDKDANAISLAAAVEQGILPDYGACLALYESRAVTGSGPSGP